jgi:predicted ATPase/signal transduction histidine kinase
MSQDFNSLTLDRRIHESQRYTLYQVHSKDDLGILKVMNDNHPSLVSDEEIEREYEISSHLETSAALRVEAKGFLQGRPAILLENFEAVSLDEFAGHGLQLGNFLEVAIKITACLVKIHAQDVIHKDIKPSNILIQPASGEVKFTDFGIAAVLENEKLVFANPLKIEGSFPFMSPEQTGRINHPIDFRSDLYSLGITLFKTLTGFMPFHGDDVLEWVHCHIARKPLTVTEVKPHIPKVISKIIGKLLEKLPEDRYQTAAGLLYDFQTCQDLWMKHSSIADFALASKDLSERFKIPHKLYGREQDLQLLTTIFKRVLEEGNPEYVLISGYSGIGKTSLVQELYRPLIQQNGVFASGKFDQLMRHVPYSAIACALTEIIQQLLILEENRIGQWRETFLKSLAGNGKLLTDLIPDLKLIIGAQPEVPVLGTQEAQNRFNLTLQNFIRSLARIDHPVIIFLDDLQWADPASISCLEIIAADLELVYICFIFAYRDNEVDVNHPFIRSMERIRAQGFNVSHLHLSPLGADSMANLLSDTLLVDKKEVEPLARLLRKKTEGNAFFTLELIKSLHNSKMLTYQVDTGSWDWDLPAIDRLEITDNVVDLMIKRVRELPSKVSQTLQVASCVGAQFHASTLASVMGEDVSVTCTSLKLSMARGLLHLVGEMFAFHHDRIQQAAHSLLADSEKPLIHHKIAHALLAGPPEDVERNLFHIVNQFKAAASVIDPSERRWVADLNLKAAERSKASNGYSQALSYFMTAKELLPAALWEEEYENSFNLHRELAQTAYLAAELKLADETFSLILNHAKTTLEKAKIYYLQIKLFQVAGDFNHAITLAIDAFALFGLIMPPSPEEAAKMLAHEMALASASTQTYSPEALLNHPGMEDPNVIMLVNLLEAAGPPAYMARPELFPLIALKMVNYSINFGNTQTSCYGYGIYGILLAGVFNQVETGFKFSELALKLNERFQDPKLKGAILHLMGDHVNFWKNHLLTDLDILDQGFEACVQGGDLIYSNYIGFQKPWHMFEAGINISEILEQTRRYRSFALKTKYLPVVYTIELEQHFLNELLGVQTDVDTEKLLSEINQAKFSCGTVYFHIMKMISCYLRYDFTGALSESKPALENLAAALSMPIEFSYYFFHTLAITGNFANFGDQEKNENLNLARAYLEKFRVWSVSCPENFKGRYLLLRAEISRIEGKTSDAMTDYEASIEECNLGGFTHLHALALELAADCYQELGIKTVVSHYLLKAQKAYGQWGAMGKLKNMKSRYPDMDFRSHENVVTTTSSTGQLDFFSVIKASQTISREILLPSLLQTLMQVVLEHAGANKGLLLLEEDERLKVAASVSLGDQVKHDVEAAAISSYAPEDMPLSLIHYVQRTKSLVLLDNPHVPSAFTRDPYIEKHSPKSVLCLPLLRNNSIIGIIYLENQFMHGTFQKEKLSTLELLTAQISISIENSRLYDRSQKSVMMRDQFLSIASHELRTPLTSLLLQIQMRKRKVENQTGPVSLEELKKYIEKDERQVLKLSHLVDEMLDVSRINSDSLKLNKENVNLTALTQEVVSQMRPQFIAANQEITVLPSKDVHCPCDAARIEQAIVNLLTNSIKYGEGKPVEIQVTKDNKNAWISVKDVGKGVSLSNHERIFQQYERVLSINEASGLGLGLYISRRIIEYHNGTLLLESKLGEGSIFTISLPLWDLE